MSVYVSKSQYVEAIQWTGDNFEAIDAFAHGKVELDGAGLVLLAGQDGAQGWVPVPIGHWIVNPPEDKSDIWPVDADYFAGKYEPGGAQPQAMRAEEVPPRITTEEVREIVKDFEEMRLPRTPLMHSLIAACLDLLDARAGASPRSAPTTKFDRGEA